MISLMNGNTRILPDTIFLIILAQLELSKVIKSKADFEMTRYQWIYSG